MKSLKRVVVHDNSNHHLWNNHGTWCVHYTVYPTEFTKERVRASLKTRSIEVACRRRDQLLARHADILARPATEVEAFAA